MTTRRTGFPQRLPGLRLGPEGRKIAAGLSLIAAVLFGQDVVGAVTSGHRLDPALRNAAGPSDVLVVLDFVPERFHNERLARLGVFAGRDGSASRIRLRMVSPENLAALGRLVWVSKVEPLRPRAPAPRPGAPKS